MPATDSFENDIINHFLRGQGISTSSAWLGLSTTTPNEDGSNFTEPDTANGYARQSLGLSVPTTGTSSNGAVVTFGPAVNAGWGTITHLGVFYVSTGGTVKIYKATAPRSVGIGGSISFDTGILAVAID